VSAQGLTITNCTNPLFFYRGVIQEGYIVAKVDELLEVLVSTEREYVDASWRECGQPSR
jgi:hypothetical protein